MKKDKLPPKVRKRGNGYTYRYDIKDVLPDGSVRRKQKETKAFSTPEEAYKAGVVIEAQLIKGTFVDEKNILFTDWVEKGVELHANTKKLKQNTIDTMKSNLKYPKIVFAGRKLKDITTGEYQDLLIALRDKYNLGYSAVKAAHSAMKTLFRYAIKLKIIKYNVTEDAVLPNFGSTFEELELLDGEEPLPEFLEKEQLAKLLHVAKQKAQEEKDPSKAFGARQTFRTIYVLAHTGLRIGELCALETKRIDLEARTVRVIANLYHRNGVEAYKLTTPKNKTSIRTVDISKSVVAVLESQLRDLKTFRMLRANEFYAERQFAFVSFKRLPGYPMEPLTFNTDLGELLEAADLPKSITAHKLRHTFTSLSAEAGASLEEIQKQLGHVDDDITRRVYLHVTEARRKANVEKLDNLLSGLLPDI